MEKYIERTKDEDNIKKRFKEYFFFLQKRKAVSTFFLPFVGGVYNLYFVSFSNYRFSPTEIGVSDLLINHGS